MNQPILWTFRIMTLTAVIGLGVQLRGRKHPNLRRKEDEFDAK
jgi:hypothetical protein